jgi:hypothetical protein
MSETIGFEHVERLAVLGGSWLVARLARELGQFPWEVKVFTSARHLADIVTHQGETLEQVLKATGTVFHASDDINTDPVAADFLSRPTLGIGAGAAWTFSPDFAARFTGRLLDFMGIPLPEYRGGAHYTWMVLNQERRGACNLQVVLGGQETFHRGPVIKSTNYALPLTARTPQDYFDAALAEETRFLMDFLDEVMSGRRFSLCPLDEAAASYFPFLLTKVHGWIDWSGSAAEVTRFIGAFDNPYSGASTQWRGRRVFLKGAAPEGDGGAHPFTRGLIFRNDERGVWACTRDGSVRIERVLDESGADISSQIEPGSRFVTPVEKLEEALASEITYSASGPKVEKLL